LAQVESVSGSEKSRLWLVRPRPAFSPRLRLFCIPHAGGGPSTFRRWPPHLPADVECCLVQLPGKESRILETPVRRMEDLVGRIHAAILPLLDRPFAFFGHSMGGMVAFELARALRRAQERLPSRLFISGTRAPTMRDNDPPIGHLRDADFLAEIRSRYDAMPKDVLESRELLELVLPGLRADFELLESHVHRVEPPLDVPITALGGLEDHRVGEVALGAWAEQTCGEFEMCLFPGAHFFVQTCEAQVLRYLGSRLERLLL
jgi:surfactin synthase thioesterase subunit